MAELDYGPISKTVTAKPWSDPTSNPLSDLKAAQRLVSGTSEFTADVIVMGKEAADAFEANANVLNAYDKQWVQQGILNRSAVTVGVTALGTLRGIPLYVSEEQYEDQDGSMKFYCPPDQVLVAASGVQSSMCYAAAQLKPDSGILVRGTVLGCRWQAYHHSGRQ